MEEKYPQKQDNLVFQEQEDYIPTYVYCKNKDAHEDFYWHDNKVESLTGFWRWMFLYQHQKIPREKWPEKIVLPKKTYNELYDVIEWDKQDFTPEKDTILFDGVKVTYNENTRR